MATNTLSNRGYRTSIQPEQLESRVMLSASPIDTDTDVTAVYANHAFQKGGTGDGRFELQITGKEVGFAGPLPVYMTGTISYVMSNGTVLDNIGTYSETLTPILMDINADSIPDFVGTNGISTLTFYAGKMRDIVVGTIVTTNTSFIQGVTAAGEMLVGSTGVISGCSGIFKAMTGTFTSASTVSLAPEFAMQTTVQFVIQDCKFDLRSVAKTLGPAVSSIAGVHNRETADALAVVFSGDSGKHKAMDHAAEHAAKSGSDNAPPRHVVDRLVDSADHVDRWIGKQQDRIVSELAQLRWDTAS
jgi:hypothetical protein